MAWLLCTVPEYDGPPSPTGLRSHYVPEDAQHTGVSGLGAYLESFCRHVRIYLAHFEGRSRVIDVMSELRPIPCRGLLEDVGTLNRVPERSDLKPAGLWGSKVLVLGTNHRVCVRP